MYICHSEGEWARQNILSAFEWGMVVGARCTGVSVSRTATLLGFLTLNSFLSMFPRIEAVLRAKVWGATQYYEGVLNVLYTPCIFAPFSNTYPTSLSVTSLISRGDVIVTCKPISTTR